jgi:hypothetical protein
MKKRWQHANLLEETEPVCLDVRPDHFSVGKLVEGVSLVRKFLTRTRNILKRMLVCPRYRVPHHDGVVFGDVADPHRDGRFKCCTWCTLEQICK